MPSSLAFRIGLLVVASFLASQSVCVASDTKKPYTIRLVVDVAEHRLLTDVFKQQLRRELRDGVQTALGKLATVEVTDKHDLLANIRKLGLQKALDGWREPGKEKIHFVRIDFNGTRYEIQSRQYDGELQVASPIVRQERTRDRAFVARTAALLIERDIGLSGTITSEPDNARQVKVEWQAGELGDVSRWLKKGEVLAIAAPPESSERTYPFTLLQIETEPKDGVSTCTLFSRYQLRQTTGMRCLLLGTRTGGVRLRLLEAKREGGVTELRGQVNLEFRQRGFDGDRDLLLSASGSNDEVNTAKQGDKGTFSRVVFVSVRSGTSIKARMPIPLLDDRVITLTVPPDDEGTNEILDRHRALARNVLFGSLLLAERFAEINKLTADANKRSEALTSIKKTLERSREDQKRFERESNELAKELEKLEPKNRPSMKGIEAHLERYNDVEKKLLAHIEVLEKIEKEENDPKKKEWKFLIEQAKGFEKEGNVEEAIKTYQKALEKIADADIKKHVATLEQQWKPANKEHAESRVFIAKTYPNLSTADLLTRWKEIESHFEECKKVSDRWGPLHLLKATEKHRTRILKEGEILKPNLNPDDEKPAKLIADLAPKLRKLDEDLRAYLK